MLYYFKLDGVRWSLVLSKVSRSSLSLSQGNSSCDSISTVPSTSMDDVQVLNETAVTNTGGILRLKIQIGEKMFVVPVVQSQLDLTIDWLCKECSRRYFE